MENGGEGADRQSAVLIIDDAPENLKVAVSLLEAYSFTILTARDGETGIKRAKLALPDAILLDVQMPGIDGHETCRRLKADPTTAGIPVIFMTVLADLEHKVRGFEAGGVDHVTKPVEAGELLARVKTQLRLRSLQRELERQNERLEARVAERTASLEREVADREAQKREREHLLDLVRAQSDQLRGLTQGLVDAQRDRDRGFARTLREHVQERLRLASMHVDQAARLAADPHLAGAATTELRAHLASALDLLRPAVEGAAGVETGLESAGPAVRTADNPLMRLSTREYEILQLIARGKANKEIASALDIARTTVSTHRQRIMEKLEVTDLPALIRLALQHEEPGG